MATDTSLIEDDWVLERGDGSSEAAGGGAPVAGGWGGVTAQELDAEEDLEREAGGILRDLAGKSVVELCMCPAEGKDGEGRVGGAAAREAEAGGRLLGPFSDGARSCVVYLLNATPLALMLEACDSRSRSRWPYPPPPKINPGAEVVLACEAAGGPLAVADASVSYSWRHTPESTPVTFQVWWSSKVGGWMSYRSAASAGFRVEREYLGERFDGRRVLLTSSPPSCFHRLAILRPGA